MTNKNTVYTVTPPDLKLNLIGPSVLLLGVTLEEHQPYADLYDKLFPEVEITFYVGDDQINHETVPWYRACAGMASSICVNLDNVTAEEVFLAVQVELEKRALVFWMSEEKTNPMLVSLLNSYQYQVFSTLDEVEQFLLNEYGKNS